MKMYHAKIILSSLALLIFVGLGHSSAWANSGGLAEAVEYRGGNGMHSPDGRWYAELFDGYSESKKMMYLRFRLYHGDLRGQKTPRDIVPDVDLIVPCDGIYARSMDLSWSPDGKVFFAKYLSVVDVIDFTYDRSNHSFKLERSSKKEAEIRED